MKISVLLSSALALSLASFVRADPPKISKKCLPAPASDICYSLNIPSDTASSGSGDIFFQITAPSKKYQWVGLGQGVQMDGSNMFVIYTNALGTSVTLSPRFGTGHVMPKYDQNSAGATLLKGSSINSNGMMTANVRCSNCAPSSFQSPSTDWIYAYRTGNELNTNDLTTNIQAHDVKGSGSLTFSKASAAGGSSNNPFVVVAAVASSSENPSAHRTVSDEAANETTKTEATSAQHSSGGKASRTDSIELAHGIMAVSAFIVFIIGGMTISLFRICSVCPKPDSNPANLTGCIVRFHYGIQIFGWLVFVIAFGAGVYLAKELDYLTNIHAIIGYVLFIALLAQPVLGWMHHCFTQGTRGCFTWTHLLLGRALIPAGLVNGFLGLHLAGAKRLYLDLYIAFGILVFLTYLGTSIWGECRRRNGTFNELSDEKNQVLENSQPEIYNTQGPF